MTLYDFEGGFAFDRVEARDVKVTESELDGNSWLRMAVGHAQDWPGITLPAPECHWDLSKFTQVQLDVRNVGDAEATLCCRVDNPGADGVRNCNTDRVTLKPGEAGTLTVTINRRPAVDPDIKLFAMRGYPEPYGGNAQRAIDPANVTQVLVFVPQPKSDSAFEIDNLRAVGEHVEPPLATMTAAQFFPFIDTFGQYIHKDWPGKTHSLEELKERTVDETADLTAHPGPEGWDEYGDRKSVV